MIRLLFLVPILLLAFSGFGQANKLSSSQEDSVLRLIDETLLKFPDKKAYKHRRSMIQGGQLILCYTVEDDKGRLELYNMTILDLKNTYFESYSLRSIGTNQGCVIREKYHLSKKKSDYDENVFSDTSQFKQNEFGCKNYFYYASLDYLNKVFVEQYEANFIHALYTLAKSYGGGNRVFAEIPSLDKLKNFIGLQFDESRSMFENVLLKEPAKRRAGFLFEKVDTSKSDKFRSIFGANIKNILLGFNDQAQLKRIQIEYYNSDRRNENLAFNLENAFGKPTETFRGNTGEWDYFIWQGKNRRIQLQVSRLQWTHGKNDERFSNFIVTIE